MILIMLYMNFDSNNFVKIGYAKDPQKRYKAYKTHNPTMEMRWTCAGNVQKEKKAQKDLVKLNGVRKIGTEWFQVSDEVYTELYTNGFKAIKSRKSVINRKFEPKPTAAEEIASWI